MQGPSPSRIARAGIAVAFAATFLAGAFTIFAIVGTLGAWLLPTTRVPTDWRLGLAGAAVLPLALVDLRAMTRSTYCPIGMRRQTPRILLRQFGVMTAAPVWGFDTGLVVTTFRVAAVSWAALGFVALDLAPWWAGLGYGLGFTVPFLILLARPRLGRASRAASAVDPGLEAMLRARSAMQGVSAAVLLATSAILLRRLIA